MTPQEKRLVAAVRKSLNLPQLDVSVRRNGQRWLFQLHLNGASSEWLELGPDDIRVMKQLGLVPALHLGTFRVAYAGLRRTAPQ
ncbi:MAG: hypothetical protein HYX72_13465 [Acidobacteria bacterium]|nr:hypothetical protein [Acidobacteriota bacterium]